jgi:hypothetical protein
MLRDAFHADPSVDGRLEDLLQPQVLDVVAQVDRVLVLDLPVSVQLQLDHLGDVVELKG